MAVAGDNPVVSFKATRDEFGHWTVEVIRADEAQPRTKKSLRLGDALAFMVAGRPFDVRPLAETITFLLGVKESS